MVTSSSRTALSVQLAGLVTATVNVSVIDGIGVCVIEETRSFVGGRVDVMNATGVGVSVSTEMDMHDVSASAHKNIIFLNIYLRFFARTRMNADERGKERKGFFGVPRARWRPTNQNIIN
jgi:hypothetical protein